ncbi:MAG: hypothetical protein NT020_12790 [Chloroflexales bacterium]|nr:hypothetical protein [Chloroflexales bacterium]
MFQQGLSCEPTPDKIAVAMGIFDRVVHRLLQSSTQLISLAQPITCDGNGKIVELLAAEMSDFLENRATRRMFQQDITSALHEFQEP